MKKYLDFAIMMAKKAGRIMKKYFKRDNGASYKYDDTIVTLADKETNNLLIQLVKKYFPTHSVDGEEETFGKSDCVWVCDPVDGTAMYARHIPVAVFSLAFVKNGEPLVGVVYDPWTNSMYNAVKGAGAYLNGKKIHVSDIKLGDKRMVGHYDMWPNSEYNVKPVVSNLQKSNYIVSIGSVIRAGLCVASGDFGFVIFPGTIRKNCDIAAIKIIVEEAGGKVTDFFGKEQRYDQSINGALVTNGIVHDDILKELKKHLEDKKNS